MDAALVMNMLQPPLLLIDCYYSFIHFIIDSTNLINSMKVHETL